MSKPLILTSTKLLSKVIWAMAGCMLFSVGVPGIVNFYYQYVDTTQYINFKSDIATDKATYAPCEKLTLTFQRKSLGNYKVESNKALIEIKTLTGSIDKRFLPTVVGVIPQGEAIVNYPSSLPCDLDEGMYYFEGSFTYTVRELQKITYWKSTNFVIKYI